MYIKIKDADFSGNNLGKITIPIELDSTTNLICQNMTGYSSSSSQAIALDTFIRAIKNANLWSKVKIFLPYFMAGSLDEFKFDACGNTLAIQGESYATFNSSAKTITKTNSSLPSVSGINTNISDNWVLVSSSLGTAISKINGGSTKYNSILMHASYCRMANVSNIIGIAANYYGTGENVPSSFGLVSLKKNNDGTLSSDSFEIVNSQKLSFSAVGSPELLTGSNADNVSIAGLQATTISFKNCFVLIGNGTPLTESEGFTIYNAAKTLRETLTELG